MMLIKTIIAAIAGTAFLISSVTAAPAAALSTPTNSTISLTRFASYTPSTTSSTPSAAFPTTTDLLTIEPFGPPNHPNGNGSIIVIIDSTDAPAAAGPSFTQPPSNGNARPTDTPALSSWAMTLQTLKHLPAQNQTSFSAPSDSTVYTTVSPSGHSHGHTSVSAPADSTIYTTLATETLSARHGHYGHHHTRGGHRHGGHSRGVRH